MGRKADNKEVGRRRSKQNHIAGMFELYVQMLPTRLYTSKKIRTTPGSEVLCRLCGKFPESVPHVLTGCPALAQNKYLSRHNAALKILFFELVRDPKLGATLVFPGEAEDCTRTAKYKYSGTFPCMQTTRK